MWRTVDGSGWHSEARYYTQRYKAINRSWDFLSELSAMAMPSRYVAASARPSGVVRDIGR